MRVTMCASNEPYLNEVDLYYPISVCLNNDHHCGNLFEPTWALQLSSLVVLHNGNHLQAQKLFPIVGIISKEFMCIQNIFFSFVSCYVSNSVILYVKSCIATSLDSMSSHLIAHVHMNQCHKPSANHLLNMPSSMANHSGTLKQWSCRRPPTLTICCQYMIGYAYFKST